MKKIIFITLVVFAILLAFMSCESNKDKPVKIAEKKEYLPSKDTNSVFWHITWAQREMDYSVGFQHMLMADSLFKMGHFKYFTDIKYKMYYKNESLDSLINFYSSKYGKPLFVGSEQFEGHYENMIQLNLGYQYDKQYFLNIYAIFIDKLQFKKYYKINTKRIKYFYWFPYLVNFKEMGEVSDVEKDTILQHDKYYRYLHKLQLKKVKVIDSINKILNPPK